MYDFYTPIVDEDGHYTEPYLCECEYRNQVDERLEGMVREFEDMNGIYRE
jgi:hypothetical protein